MDVVFIAPFAPDPRAPHAGGQFFSSYLAHLSSRGVKPSVIVPASEDNIASLRRGSDLDVQLVEVPPSLWQRRVPAKARSAVLGIAPPVGFARALLGNADAVRSIRSAHVVELQWSQTLPLVGAVRRLTAVPIVAFEHDVLAQSLKRQSRVLGSLAFKIGASVAARVAARREPRLLNRCDAVFTFSEKDERLLRKLGVTTPVHVVSPSVVVPQVPHGPAAEPVALFVGALWRWENEDAARRLVHDIWPLVSGHHPAAKVVLAGADPPDWLQRCANDEVEVTGFVDDLGAVYERARVFVAPLYSGAGLKFKVLDAMAHGLPVVATHVAAEGIHDISGGREAFGIVSDDTLALAGAVARALEDRHWAEEIGRNAHTFVARHFSFERSIDEVVEVYQSVHLAHVSGRSDGRRCGSCEQGRGSPA